VEIAAQKKKLAASTTLILATLEVKSKKPVIAQAMTGFI